MKKITVLAVLLLCLLTGCGAETPEPVEITLLHGWGTMESEHVRMREIYQDFETTHPNIRLKLASMPSAADVLKKVRNMLSVGEVPDIVFTSGYGADSVYRFMVDQGKALDLMPIIQSDPELAACLNPDFPQVWGENGSLYTLSDVLLAGGGFWYNAEMFRKAGISAPPESWQEFFACCEQLLDWAEREKNGVIPVQLTQESSVFVMNSLLSELDSTEELTPETLAPALEVLRRIYEYDPETAKGYGYRDVGRMFNQEKVAIYLNGVWVSSLIDEALPARYAPMPGTEGQTTACLSAGLGYIVGQSGEPEKTAACVELLKYLLSDSTQQRILYEAGQMPSSPRITVGEDAPRMQQAIGAIRGADRRIEAPSNQWTTGQIQNFRNSVFPVLRGEMSAEELLILLNAQD